MTAAGLTDPVPPQLIRPIAFGRRSLSFKLLGTKR